MVAIERDNTQLKGILPKNYASPSLDKARLGELIDLFGPIEFAAKPCSGAVSAPASEDSAIIDRRYRSKDILGRVYDYFLSQFASAEGKKGGQFYTPQSFVRLLVEMLAPYKGRVYDPAAVPAACSCNRKNSSKPTVAGSAT